MAAAAGLMEVETGGMGRVSFRGMPVRRRVMVVQGTGAASSLRQRVTADRLLSLESPHMMANTHLARPSHFCTQPTPPPPPMQVRVHRGAHPL